MYLTSAKLIERSQTVRILWFHLYKEQKEAKLVHIYAVRALWKKAQVDLFTRLSYFLIWALDAMMYSVIENSLNFAFIICGLFYMLCFKILFI